MPRDRHAQSLPEEGPPPGGLTPALRALAEDVAAILEEKDGAVADEPHLAPPPELDALETEAEPTGGTPSAPLRCETLRLLQAYLQQPSTDLRNRLVHLNLGLARKEAYHWANQCTEPFEDLLQVGVMGLIRAIERFDPGRGHAFSTFAIPYIRGEIQHYLRDRVSPVRIPRQWMATYQHGSKVQQRLRGQLQREPSDRELAQALNISLEDWQNVRLACQNRVPLSLDAPANEHEDSSASLGELMPDRKYCSFQLAQEDSLRLYQALDTLEDRTREILEFVFIKEFTYREVADSLGISAVTVSRQVKKGLAALKHILTAPIE
ncbi:MAG: RNA polymerase sigma factor SigF [Oscillatoriales cyanobacterium SM2_1_8]|nr:RNA polymerase sigma factor SigF [Oscillatoriales cyanobacterium SM2_1_8]